MIITKTNNQHTNPIEAYIQRLESGQALLNDTPQNLIEVVGILKSYGIILDAYSNNLIYIAEKQFLVLFNFFKYFNGDFSFKKLLIHWWHDRINYEYAEYCMKTMLWHGGGGLDEYLDTPEFQQRAEKAIRAKLKNNIFMLALHKIFPEFLPEQIRQFAYYSGLGQFWRIMSDMFLDLSDRYDRGEIKAIPDVVEHIKNGLVAAANKPITYQVEIRGQQYDIIPKSAGLTFLNDTAVPYVEAVFFRGTPFPGTVSYNAQAYQIPVDQGDFAYGALYADPLPVGGAGIPPTLLMHDMSRYLPDYLHNLYRQTTRGEDDILVQICQSFQKSMFCVTTAAVEGLAPYPLATENPEEKAANRKYLKAWLNRLKSSEMLKINS
ncbi:CO2 hydration protein [Oscillatoria salina]|uniref:CO2 hydration protein n=1 Tax=Oscillatoria salina TaxID=331517 RepID=UPI0013B5D347|nr:CO2 hydration protein [Oscillatoria salina]MBZ8180701.1 CO2 hydration protein [Oscillatoria salina IIICB1]NET87567.1 CO2 hydration protein [Kamptonema sp. SIO1D9]